MFSVLACFGVCARSPSLSLPSQSQSTASLGLCGPPPNSLEYSEPVEQGWDMIATAVLVFRLYSFQQQMSSEWEQEQLVWLTEHYGSWTERVLLRLRGR